MMMIIIIIYHTPWKIIKQYWLRKLLSGICSYNAQVRLTWIVLSLIIADANWLWQLAFGSLMFMTFKSKFISLLQPYQQLIGFCLSVLRHNTQPHNSNNNKQHIVMFLFHVFLFITTVILVNLLSPCKYMYSACIVNQCFTLQNNKILSKL